MREREHLGSVRLALESLLLAMWPLINDLVHLQLLHVQTEPILNIQGFGERIRGKEFHTVSDM